MSPRSDEDFPTPKARLFDITPQPSPRFPFPPNSSSYPKINRASRADSDFDSLYDVTDDEAEVPLHASASVKKISGPNRRVRFPSLIIPSPTAWPTIEKLKSATSAVPMTPSALLTPSRRVLEMINSHNLHLPGHSAAPSLDGSLTSEELDKLSCPATPDMRSRRDSFSTEGSWAPPVQLDFQAMHTLQHLGESAVEEEDDQETSSAELRGEMEMQQVSRPSLGLTIPSSQYQNESEDDNTPISAISIPSPGGFFSSLQSGARATWSIPARQDSIPNTSTAEKFYNLPWESHKTEVMPALPDRPLTLSGETLDGLDEVLATARPAVFSPVEENVEVKEINPSKSVFLYNENYNAELQKLSSVNLEMTGRWLEEQDELSAALRIMSNMDSSSISSGTHSRSNSVDKPVLKKSVTFAEEPAHIEGNDEEPKKIQTYVQGLEYIRSSCEKKDTFIHRQTRAEAMHLQRRCNPAVHRDQLMGKYELNEPERPAPARPVSEFYVNDPTALKERIARAQTERQALDQMLPSQWVMQAHKQLNGGKLLSKPAARCITRASSPRILDVGGIATNDWAWNVAYDYPYAAVVTVNTAGNNASANIVGPDNHKYTSVPNLWTLPFPNAHFDVISARTLYELLKTNKPAGRSSDEYDLCLKELHRCLKPGGILEFSLLDAELMHAGRNAQAMGVEFGFNLKTRGYDAQASKTFLPRVAKAGFRDVQRAWIVLPMGQTAANWKEELNVCAKVAQEKCIGESGEVEVQDVPAFGSTRDAAMLTGIVGSWAWERWMLRLQMEMGKEEEKLLEGVVQVLEEGARQGCAWRSLTGWARNFFKTLVEHEITVELKNEVQIRGTLKSVDQYLNIKLDNAEAVDEVRWPHLCSTKDMFIRGSVIRYVHLPSGAVDTALLEDATRRETEAAKNKAK
ncbi:verprolin [Didymella exigua CBS 183.55]|uniref:Verprolin n=1 Tax=Didymella exigua CBS 183.55 TaxID=1150837 RepID=A0A6A5RCX3_9PLEO|nr:verprolin [Didymella exigua CBS 183.55]KAF1925343.1 verprolin [Didymella exigua CBS 183.55]